MATAAAPASFMISRPVSGRLWAPAGRPGWKSTSSATASSANQWLLNYTNGARAAAPGRRSISSTAIRRSSNRQIHSSSNRTSPSAADPLVLNTPSTTAAAAAAALTPSPSTPSPAPRPSGDMAKAVAPLSVLPLSAILRSFVITSISSSRLLLPPSLAIMDMLANTRSSFLNPDKNPLLRYLIKNTFYVQFCAGENPAEVRQTMARLKNLGFSGVILGYAREVVMDENEEKGLSSSADGLGEDGIRNEVDPWAAGTLETVRLAEPGDFVALKFTGAGTRALYELSQQLPPSPVLAKAIDEICSLAASRGVRLLFDAEQQAVQAGIDDWTLHYMRKYNGPSSSGTAAGAAAKAIVYGTYQAYLKATPKVLSGHLQAAQDAGFTLGVKLVRGAYLGSDPRRLIHDSKEDTDAAYNGITEALLRRKWSGPLAAFRPAGKEDAADGGAGAFPGVNLVLASHNAETMRLARAILDGGERGTEVAFGQLQGMADEVSCELVYAKGKTEVATEMEGEESFRPQAYKYMVWGSTGECMKYLLRRAQENRDAVQRTKSGRDAMRGELWRRFRGVFGA